MNKKIAFLSTIFPMKEEYLFDFFNSLKNQSYKKFDVIIVNDGYQEFKKIKKIYESKLNIIELRYSKTPAKNREFGINYCLDNKYDYLIFGDSDDFFASNRIEKVINLLKDYDIVVNDLNLFNEKGVYLEKYISNRINNNTIIKLDYILDKNIFGMTNTAINLKNMEKVSFSNDLVAVDWFLFKSLLSKKLKAIFINNTVSFYRQYLNNTIGLNKKNGKYYLWWEEE